MAEPLNIKTNLVAQPQPALYSYIICTAYCLFKMSEQVARLAGGPLAFWSSVLWSFKYHIGRIVLEPEGWSEPGLAQGFIGPIIWYFD